MTPQRSADRTERPGFVALTSVLLLSSIALLVSLVAVGNMVLALRDSVGAADGSRAHALAVGCADVALLRLKVNSGYTGNEVVPVDSLTCHISALTENGDARTIYADATVNDAVSRVKVEVSDVNTLTVSSWTEIP